LILLGYAGSLGRSGSGEPPPREAEICRAQLIESCRFDLLTVQLGGPLSFEHVIVSGREDPARRLLEILGDERTVRSVHDHGAKAAGEPLLEVRAAAVGGPILSREMPGIELLFKNPVAVGLEDLEKRHLTCSLRKQIDSRVLSNVRKLHLRVRRINRP